MEVSLEKGGGVIRRSEEYRGETPLCLRSTGDKAILKQKGGENE
jgi:hypothetical protein